MAKRQQTHILHLQTPGIGAAAKPRRSVPHGAAYGATADDDSVGAGRGSQDQKGSDLNRAFTVFANQIAHLAGRPISFVLCCVIIIGWAVSGPIFHYSDTWQLIINTGTTIITFLMVFLIQNTQNRDGAAVQAKLDELIRALEGARNHFIGIEHLTEEQLEAIRAVCEREAKEEGAEAGRNAALDVEQEVHAQESKPPR